MKLLEVINISKSFSKRKVLEDISFSVESGSIVAITGENGSGKSTLLNLIIGWLEPDNGMIKMIRNFGYCPQNTLLFPGLTVMENIDYFMTAYSSVFFKEGKKQSIELLNEFNLVNSLDKKVNILSEGTKQKLNVIISLLHDPDLMILDEPYSSLDWDTYQKFWEYAVIKKKEGKSILIVSHFMYEHAMIDKLYIIKNHKLQCE